MNPTPNGDGGCLSNGSFNVKSHAAASVIALIVGIGVGVLAINSLPFVTQTNHEALRAEMIAQNQLLQSELRADEASMQAIQARQDDVLKRVGALEVGLGKCQEQLGNGQLRLPPGG
jgi:hypothetical protein